MKSLSKLIILLAGIVIAGLCAVFILLPGAGVYFEILSTKQAIV